MIGEIELGDDLRLRPIGIEDAAELAALIARNHDSLDMYLPKVATLGTPERAREHLEASCALFARGDFNRIELRCSVENSASAKLALRLGFTREGRLRQAECLHGRYHDHDVFGLLRHEYVP